MAKLKIENNLAGKDFYYEKKGGISGTIPCPPTVQFNPIPISDGDELLFSINGNPGNKNTIYIGIPNCSHCLEIIDFVSQSSTLYYTRFKFSPIKFITDDILLVRSQPEGVATVDTHQGYCDVIFTNNRPNECTVHAKIGDIDDVKMIDHNVVNALLYNFSNKTTFEFFVTCGAIHVKRYMITIDKHPYIIRKYGDDKTEVSIECKNIGPNNINITIEPD